MKANEAPEKLYFGDRDKGILDVYSKRESNDEIEYIQTDVFIKKAREFFIEKFEIDDYNINVDGLPLFDYGKLIENFKNYMEGGSKV